MLIKNQKIKIKWTTYNKDWYESKGYLFTKYNDYFFVDINDLKTGSNAKVKVICDYCGKKFEQPYRQYLKNTKKNPKNKCNECKKIQKEQMSAKRRDSMYEVIVQKFKEKGYILLTKKEEIYDNKTDIYYICLIHGVQKMKYDSIRKGASCYPCSRKTALQNKNKTTLKSRQDNLYEKALIKCKENGYTFLTPKEEIINNVTYVKYLCSKHGVQEMRISNLINGRKCPECQQENKSVRYRLNSDEVERRITEYGGVLLNKDEYINNTTKNLVILCPICKKPFTTSLRNFTQHKGQVCEECAKKKSIGEKRIEQYLIKNSIKYIPQYWFKDCRDIKPLPFDFYLPDLNTVCEFDGRQHFEETDYFRHDLNSTREHDKIKNQYCTDNSINIIRIPYYDIDKIDEILDNKLALHEDIV